MEREESGSNRSHGMFSFQESKSLTSGEGGIVLTNDEELAEEHDSSTILGEL